MNFTCTILSIVFCLIQWWFAQAQSAVLCESPGVCEESGTECVSDSRESCFPNSGDGRKMYASYEVTGEDRLPQQRRKFCPSSGTFNSGVTLRDLKLDYISVNPSYVTLQVSWALTQSNSNYGGYELRVMRTRDRVMCVFCLGNSNRTTAYIRDVKYEYLSSLYSIDVLPCNYPRENEGFFKQSQRLRTDIGGCADVKHNGTICNVASYPSPDNLNVASTVCEDGTKRLNISWDPPRVGPDVTLPDLYHVKVNSRYFIVKKAHQLVLYNLSAAHNYSAEIQPYRRCAGLGTFDETQFGCGRRSTNKMENLVGTCDSFQYTTAENSQTTNTRATALNSTGEVFSDPPYFVLVLILAISIALVVGMILIILIIILGIKFYKHFKNQTNSHVYPKSMVCRVFVFYSPSVNQAHLDYIQKHVICNLMKYFEVVTPNDINSGNVSMWLEDMVNSADSVLLVGNEDFCSEWEKKERSPILNSLELLVSAAASLNSIAKFGFISTGDSSKDVRIPENSYLKLMPVFLMGKHKCEEEKLYQFVTKSRGIEFTNV